MNAPVARLEYRKFPDRNRDAVPILGFAIFQVSRYHTDHSDFIDLPQVWLFQTSHPSLRKACYRCSVAIQHKNVTSPVTFQSDRGPGLQTGQ